MKHRILIVDDDPLVLGSLSSLLTNRGYLVDTAGSGEDAVLRVQTGHRPYSVVLLDYRMSSKDGAETASELLKVNRGLYILIHSGDPSRKALQTTWEAGAVGFIEKGGSPSVLVEHIERWCRKFEETRLTVDFSMSLGELSEEISSIQMVGRSRALYDVVQRVKRYRNKSESVLILGETGTGKELVARALCEQQNFLAVNCASYNGNSEMMEADLFGYRKGAFTGATSDHVGVLEAAKGGIVFLDEIHALDPKAQSKLLRAIQEKSIRRLGSVAEESVEFRLVASSKPDLEKKAENGSFLPDLFERLNVLKITVPPLREHPEDIVPLAAYFCERYTKESGEQKQLLSRTVKYLERYSWPRNVRELENTILRLCVDTPGADILPEHLDAKFFVSEHSAVEAPTVRQKLDGILRHQIEEALAVSASKRDAARRLRMPESSLRRFLKRIDQENSLGA